MNSNTDSSLKDPNQKDTVLQPNASRPLRLAVVIPCFNESQSIEDVVAQILFLLKELENEKVISSDSYLFFVDDGSSDDSWMIIRKLSNLEKNKKVKGLKLSKNFGHQAALLAGLSAVTNKCDVSISIDADLQQDPLAIKKFIIEFKKGAEIVLGVRKDRNIDSWFKKKTALGFYWIMKIMGVPIIPNHADYRLLSNKALQTLVLFPEYHIFLRAMCLEFGFRTSTVLFEVKPRQYGKTKYSLKKMLILALNGITSFSILPLRMIAIIGILLAFFSSLMGLYITYHALCTDNIVSGWGESISISIYFMGGVQLLCLGIVGEYIGKIYMATKNRPRWICEDKL